MSFQRIKVNDKTEALMKAMEIAEDCDFMVVLYQGKENSKVGQGFVHVGEVDMKTLNWYIDRFKLWLLGPLRTEE